MAIRKVREMNDEIIRKKSKEVEVVDDKIRELLDDMLETLRSYQGLGLAAVQVGVLKRIIIIDLPDGEGTFKLINPKIKKAKGKQVAEEGCLSIPNRYAQVERPEEITIEALNENGEKITLEAKEILAVVLSHELDHLEGELFIDKMIPGTLEIVTPEDLDTKKEKRKEEVKKHIKKT